MTDPAIVVAYEHINFGGERWRIDRTMNAIGSPAYKNISSIRVHTGHVGSILGRVYFFSDPDFSGQVLAIKPGYQISDLTKTDRIGSFACIDLGNWNDEAASVHFDYHVFEGCCLWAPPLNFTELPNDIQSQCRDCSSEGMVAIEKRLTPVFPEGIVTKMSEAEIQQLGEDLKTGKIKSI